MDRLTLPKDALEGLTPDQKAEVLKEFYRAAGEAITASQWSDSIVLAALCLAAGIAGYAFFKYGLKHVR